MSLPEPPPLPEIVLSRDLTHQHAAREERLGLLRRARHGAYLAAVPDDPGWRQQRDLLLARALSVSRNGGPDSVLSHTTAAVVHGCWLWTPDTRVHTWQNSSPGGHGAPDRQRRRLRAPLEPEESVWRGELRLTSLERTVIDCAKVLHPRDALVVADSALRMLVHPDRRAPHAAHQRTTEVRHRMLRRLKAIGGYGTARAAAIIRHASPWAESPYESVLRWVAISRGLPSPTPQLRLATRLGTFYVDLGWIFDTQPGDGRQGRWLVLAEADGAVKYDGAGALRAEKHREDALRELPGVHLVRFTGRDLHDAGRTFSRLLAMMPPATRQSCRRIPALLTVPAAARAISRSAARSGR